MDTKSTFSIIGFEAEAQLPVPSYAFDYQGIPLYVFKTHGSWLVGESTTDLTISVYITSTLASRPSMNPQTDRSQGRPRRCSARHCAKPSRAVASMSMHQLSHLTPEELGRYAYLVGDPLADRLEEAAELFDLADTEDDRLDQRYAQGFSEGRLEGLGPQAADQIKKLDQQLSDMTRKHQSMADEMRNLLNWLPDDQCKTVKGRREVAQYLQRKLTSLW